MKERTATIREIRTDFRSVRRKIEQFGEIVITDRGEPVYLLKALPRTQKKRHPLPDYCARLHEQRPQPMSAKATREFWEEERGGR